MFKYNLFFDFHVNNYKKQCGFSLFFVTLQPN